MKPTRITTLEAARNAVLDRPTVYGVPEDCFARVASVWRAIFPEREWTASDVALGLAALKLVRLSFDPTHFDSSVDLAGYAACQAECAVAKTINDIKRATNGANK